MSFASLGSANLRWFMLSNEHATLARARMEICDGLAMRTRPDDLAVLFLRDMGMTIGGAIQIRAARPVNTSREWSRQRAPVAIVSSALRVRAQPGVFSYQSRSSPDALPWAVISGPCRHLRHRYVELQRRPIGPSSPERNLSLTILIVPLSRYRADLCSRSCRRQKPTRPIGSRRFLPASDDANVAVQCSQTVLGRAQIAGGYVAKDASNENAESNTMTTSYSSLPLSRVGSHTRYRVAPTLTT